MHRGALLITLQFCNECLDKKLTPIEVVKLVKNTVFNIINFNTIVINYRLLYLLLIAFFCIYLYNNCLYI
jgi:hypothetical protein